MKLNLTYKLLGLSACIVGALALASCSDSVYEEVQNPGKGETTVTFSTNIVAPVETGELSGRALGGDNTDNRIDNLHVVAFNAQGTMVAHGYTASSQAANGGTFSMNIAGSLDNLTFYAIANIGNPEVFANHALNKEAFEALTIKSADGDIASGNYSLYNGAVKLCDITGATAPVLVSGEVAVTVTNNVATVTLNLVRQCAKVTVNITASDGKQIFAYQVRNVMAVSTLKTAENGGNPPQVEYCDAPVEEITPTTTVTKSFYVYENYNDRVAGITSQTQRNSKVAPPHATYVNVWTRKQMDGTNWDIMYQVYPGGINQQQQVDLTEFVLVRNHNYNVTVTLRGDGSADPRVSAGVSTPTVGHYLFNDGSWGPYTEGTATATHYPIAVIFSNNTTATDRSAGYFHGYAVAIASAGAQLKWAESSAAYISTALNTLKTTLADVKADRDGRTETAKIMAQDKTENSGVETTKLTTKYPSAWYATHFGTADVGLTNNSTVAEETPGSSESSTYNSSKFAAPVGTSGWFLGSIGQYWEIAKNLGGNVSENSEFSEAGTKYWYIPSVSEANKTAVEGYFSRAASVHSNTDTGEKPWLMAYLASKYSCWYWTSSEFSAANGFYVLWGNGGIFFLGGDSAKSYSDTYNRGVRPVIAF